MAGGTAYRRRSPTRWRNERQASPDGSRSAGGRIAATRPRTSAVLDGRSFKRDGPRLSLPSAVRSASRAATGRSTSAHSTPREVRRHTCFAASTVDSSEATATSIEVCRAQSPTILVRRKEPAMATNGTRYSVGGVLLPRPFKIRRLGHFGFNAVRMDEGRAFSGDLLDAIELHGLVAPAWPPKRNCASQRSRRRSSHFLRSSSPVISPLRCKRPVNSTLVRPGVVDGRMRAGRVAGAVWVAPGVGFCRVLPSAACYLSMTYDLRVALAVLGSGVRAPQLHQFFSRGCGAIRDPARAFGARRLCAVGRRGS